MYAEQLLTSDIASHPQTASTPVRVHGQLGGIPENGPPRCQRTRRATGLLNPVGLTIRTSQASSSMTRSAVWPMNIRCRPRRDTAPITTSPALSFFTLRGSCTAGSPATTIGVRCHPSSVGLHKRAQADDVHVQRARRRPDKARLPDRSVRFTLDDRCRYKNAITPTIDYSHIFILAFRRGPADVPVLCLQSSAYRRAS